MIKKIHQIWIQGEPKEDYKPLIKSVKNLNPEWEYQFWTLETLPKDFVCHKVSRIVCQADLARFELLQRFGGVYLDCDILCTKPIDSLFTEDGLYSLATPGGFPAIAMLAVSAINHPFFEEYFKRVNLQKVDRPKVSPLTSTGDVFASSILRKYDDYKQVSHNNPSIQHLSGMAWIDETEHEWANASAQLMYNLTHLNERFPVKQTNTKQKRGEIKKARSNPVIKERRRNKTITH